jgi:hypothetical protein
VLGVVGATSLVVAVIGIVIVVRKIDRRSDLHGSARAVAAAGGGESAG